MVRPTRRLQSLCAWDPVPLARLDGCLQTKVLTHLKALFSFTPRLHNVLPYFADLQGQADSW